MPETSTKHKHDTQHDTATRASRMRRFTLWAVLLLLCPALVGYAVSWAMTRRTDGTP